MAKQAFIFWEDQVITAAELGINGNGTYELALSAEQTNSTALRSLKLVMEYADILPNVLPFGFDIDCIVEGQFGSKWVPVAYQFSPFNRPTRGPTRIIQLQPEIAGFDAGVDDIIYANDMTIARISRQQGILPESNFRVKVTVTERDFGGAGAFQSVKLSGMGEAFNV